MNVNKCSNLHGRLEALVAAPRVARWRPEDGVDDHQEDAQAQAKPAQLQDRCVIDLGLANPLEC